MLPIEKTEEYFQSYIWNGKHYLFGYPPDTYPNFEWIRNLERRFLFIRDNPNFLESEAPLYLIKEMIKWGGSKKRDISPKFDDYLGSYCLADKLSNIINSLDNVASAFNAAYEIPGLGPTYATKLLRFLAPQQFGALDEQIRKAIENILVKEITKNGGSKSNKTDEYVAYINLLRDHQKSLWNEYEINMAVSEVEMAIFQWSVQENSNKRVN